VGMFPEVRQVRSVRVRTRADQHDVAAGVQRGVRAGGRERGGDGESMDGHGAPLLLNPGSPGRDGPRGRIAQHRTAVAWPGKVRADQGPSEDGRKYPAGNRRIEVRQCGRGN
jgi:hypothetical protein